MSPGNGVPRTARLLVELAALRVPPARRAEFRREWVAELDAGAREMDGRKMTWGALVAAAAGAWSDAGTLRRLDHTEGGDGMMGRWRRELVVAVRGLVRSPTFSAAAVLTLALGLGGSATVYSLLDEVVLAPLDYPEAERLVALRNQVPGVGPDAVWNLSTAQWVHLTDHATTLEAVGLVRGTGGNVQTTSGPERVSGALVTESVVGLLGLEALHGRILLPSDDQPGAPRVALLSHGFWRRALGGDPGMVGTTLEFGDSPVEVVGILEPGAGVPGWPPGAQPDLWLPLAVDRDGTFRSSHVFPGFGRLAPGATPEDAEAEMARLAQRLPEAFPRAYSQNIFERYGLRTEAVPLKESVLGTLDRNLWILFGGVLLVLLVAAANVANLFLVRMEARGRELAVRRALGAGRGAVARHLLVESGALVGMGTGLALLTAYFGVPALAALAPADLPRLDELALTPGAVGLTLALAALTTVALAAWPFLALDGPPARALGTSGRTSSAGLVGRRVRSALVVGQVALALTLTVGAALLVQTMGELSRVEVGFRPEGAVAVDIHLSQERYPHGVALWGFYRELLERVEALPGVRSAGLGEEIPVRNGYGCTIQGFGDPSVYERMEAAGLTTCAGQERVTPGYFEALGIPLLQGRALTAEDHDDPGRGAVVVSRAFADRFWPGEDPLGKEVAPSGRSEPPFYRVVGVAADVPTRAGDGSPPLSQKAVAIYYPVVQHPATPERWGGWWAGSTTLVIRTELDDPASVLPAVRRVLDGLDPEIPLSQAVPLAQLVDEATARLSFLSLLLASAALTALALAAVGLWGVVAYVVGRRTREIGMRLAVGAEPAAVVRMVVGGSLRLTTLGLGLGLVLAWLGTGVLDGLLVGVEPTDPAAWAAACLLLAGVATGAAWIPARRAATVDPAEALRGE